MEKCLAEDDEVNKKDKVHSQVNFVGGKNKYFFKSNFLGRNRFFIHR